MTVMKDKQILKQSIGLDVSKSTVAVCFSQREGGKSGKAFRVISSKTFATTGAGFKQLDAWIAKQRDKSVDLHLLMEATGVYYEELAYFLHGKAYTVSVLLPNKTAAFAKSLDEKSKNDKADARKLAQMSLERDLPVWTPPDANMLTIKRLCRERAELVHEKTAFTNRLHAKTHAHEPEKTSVKRGKEALKFLKKQIKEIEAEIKAAVEKDPVLKKKIANVCSIKGIGLVTAATVVSEANGFILFKNKAQLVSYAGYDVVENTSGNKVISPEKISKRGNYRIRRALHFPALVAVKYNAEFDNLRQRVFDNTKVTMKGYVAVQRKLLVLIYTLYKNDAVFQPNFAHNNSMIIPNGPVTKKPNRTNTKK